MNIIKRVKLNVGNRILISTDIHFNDIPLVAWDRMSDYCNIRGNMPTPSLATGVCIAKAAATIIKSEHMAANAN